MLEHLWKIFELYLNRKDKFTKANERLERRLNFLNQVKEINANEQIDANEKRAIKNGLAQIVCGSRLVDYDLVDYYYRKALLHKHSKAKLLPSYLNLSGNLGVRSA